MKVTDRVEIGLRSLDGVYIHNLSSYLKTLIPADAEDAKLDINYDFDVSIVYKREETPKEKAAREASEKRFKKQIAAEKEGIKQRELKELERLKKKYEST